MQVLLLAACQALRLAQPVMQLRGQGAQTRPPLVDIGSFNGNVVPTRSSPATDYTTIQGGSLRTFSFRSPSIRQAQVTIGSDGRPVDAQIEIWQGPGNVPCKMRVYVEDGQMYPFSAVVETPRGPNTVAIRNTGPTAYPIGANVNADFIESPSPECLSSPTIIQGGALRTFHCEEWVKALQVLLMTDGRPLEARIELLQGPNNNKQVIELYSEDGLDRPVFFVIATPGYGDHVARIVNTAPVEFPMTASVAPHTFNGQRPARSAWGYGQDGYRQDGPAFAPGTRAASVPYPSRGYVGGDYYDPNHVNPSGQRPAPAASASRSRAEAAKERAEAAKVAEMAAKEEAQKAQAAAYLAAEAARAEETAQKLREEAAEKLQLEADAARERAQASAMAAAADAANARKAESTAAALQRPRVPINNARGAYQPMSRDQPMSRGSGESRKWFE